MTHNYMLTTMNKYLLNVCTLAIVILLNSGCTTTPTINEIVDSSVSDDRLIVYADGRMKFKSRFVNEDDVVIYLDGRGGERAAIKMRVPLHPDFYRDSILVVRVVNKLDEAISQREAVNMNNTN